MQTTILSSSHLTAALFAKAIVHFIFDTMAQGYLMQAQVNQYH
jgi:hypothetical protein